MTFTSTLDIVVFVNTTPKTYHIGDIAKELDLSQRTIRYYEELGFLKPTRSDGGFRNYTEKDVELLRTVVRFKDLGLSLDDVRALILPGNQSLTVEGVNNLRESLTAQRQALEEKLQHCKEGIAHIEQILELLSHCATCGKLAAQVGCEQCLKTRGEQHSPIFSSPQKL